MLTNFLDLSTPLMRQTGNIRTQQNESINSSIGKLIPKNKTFITTNEVRTSIVIGKKNYPHFESDLYQTLCPNALSPVVNNEIKKDETNSLNMSFKRNTLKERQKKNAVRQKTRANNKEVPGD